MISTRSSSYVAGMYAYQIGTALCIRTVLIYMNKNSTNIKLPNLCCDVAILAEVVDCLRHLEDTKVDGSHREDERCLVIANNLRLEIFHMTLSSELKLIIHCISDANNLQRNLFF